VTSTVVADSNVMGLLLQAARAPAPPFPPPYGLRVSGGWEN
jgi:hypothetical protein